jgi:hypothetical protein
MVPSLLLYGSPPRKDHDQGPYQQPGYYPQYYYPPPVVYYGPYIDPYEAARQGASADRTASLIWKLVALMGILALFVILGLLAFIL